MRAAWYGNPTPVGASCARDGALSTGTLGGRLVLTKGNMSVQLGLTNSHVLLNKSTFDQERGPFPPSPALGQLSICCPSEEDYKIDSKSREIELRDATQKANMLTGGDDSVAVGNPSLEFWINRRNMHKSEMDLVTTADRKVGSIFAASGHITTPNPQYTGDLHNDWGLDWGLVRMAPSRNVSTFVESVPPPGTIFEKFEHIDSWCSIDANRTLPVRKYGRTTGWTRGKISLLASAVVWNDKVPNLKDGPTAVKITFPEKRYGERAVYCHCIANVEDKDAGFKFLSPGDSGSLVLYNGKPPQGGQIAVVGLGFGDNFASCASYMMPIDLVMRNIEQVTGGRVTYPVYRGNV
ncbi:hypothetical protein K505DRAFT_369488 [Melanomma pulvis-pyrius CBS 109.77]|uniref:Uncharacterized protein n=1 Tax=Melanomma pulvis-pyrius CBS 109.77 TaxID=1314802 RepID=A0A6A6WNK0_9PLEO|nr:hypothetical protein K505DRAFT_369488 [Melanomma pulvis-pyrius CBS 109.77]